MISKHPQPYASAEPVHIRNTAYTVRLAHREGCLKREYPFAVIHFSSRNGCAERITK
jgi:hypothetical protein